jgi:hypothetical protein
MKIESKEKPNTTKFLDRNLYQPVHVHVASCPKYQFAMGKTNSYSLLDLPVNVAISMMPFSLNDSA